MVFRWSFKKDHHQNIAYDTRSKLKTTPEGNLPDMGRTEQT